jgi:hypothetical protein
LENKKKCSAETYQQKKFHEADCGIHPLGPQKELRNCEIITHSTNNKTYKNAEKTGKSVLEGELQTGTPQKGFKVRAKEKKFKKPSKRWKDSVLKCP